MTNGCSKRFDKCEFSAPRGHLAGEPENGSGTIHLDKNPVFEDTELTLEKYDDHEYGYLRVTAGEKRLRIACHQARTRSLLQSRYGLVTVNLATHALSAN